MNEKIQPSRPPSSGSGELNEKSSASGTVQSLSRLKAAERLYRMRRWELALQELLLLKADDFPSEERIEYAYYLGLCYTKLQQFDDALLYLEQVVTSGGDPFRLYQCRMTLAYIYVITKRSKMAEFELTRLASSGLESAQFYSILAYAAWSQKQFQKAVDYYEKALDLDTNNTTALNGLGYVLVDANLDPIRGLRCCRRAVDLKPNRAAYLDSLGWAYFKNGEILEARTWLRRAIEAAPGEKEIKEHLRLVTGEA